MQEDEMRSIFKIEIVLKEGMYQVVIYKKGSENELHTFRDEMEVCAFLELQVEYLVED